MTQLKWIFQSQLLVLLSFPLIFTQMVACQKKESIELAAQSVTPYQQPVDPCCTKPVDPPSNPPELPNYSSEHFLICQSPANTIQYGSTKIKTQGFLEDVSFTDSNQNPVDIQSPLFLNYSKNELTFLSIEKQASLASPFYHLFFSSIYTLTKKTQLISLAKYPLKPNRITEIFTPLGLKPSLFAIERGSKSLLLPQSKDQKSFYSLFSAPDLFLGKLSSMTLITELNISPDQFVSPQFSYLAAGVSFQGLVSGYARILYLDLTNFESRYMQALSAQSQQVASHFSKSDRHYWLERSLGAWYLRGQKIIDRNQARTYTLGKEDLAQFKILSKSTSTKDFLYLIKKDSLEILEFDKATGDLISQSSKKLPLSIQSLVGRSTFADFSNASESQEIIISLNQSGFLIYDVVLDQFELKAFVHQTLAFTCSSPSDFLYTENPLTGTQK